MNKNKKLLKDFSRYCEKHSEQRFWQALRNWSGFSYVYAEDDNGLSDTFYFTEKDR